MALLFPKNRAPWTGSGDADGNAPVQPKSTKKDRTGGERAKGWRECFRGGGLSCLCHDRAGRVFLLTCIGTDHLS